MNSGGGTPATAGLSVLLRLPEEVEFFIEDWSMMDWDWSTDPATFSLFDRAIAMFIDLSLTKFYAYLTVDLLTFECWVINLG